MMRLSPVFHKYFIFFLKSLLLYREVLHPSFFYIYRMKFNFIILLILVTSAVTTQAQRRHRSPNPNDTISSNYQPSELFSPLFYSEKGTEFHSANGDPGPKYWQNRVDYQIKATLDTTTKTIAASESITYNNNSPDALQFLWLQLDQNTYKKDARSNFATAFSPGPNQHTTGYDIKSVSLVANGKTEKADYIISDTRMQIRLAKAIASKKKNNNCNQL